MFINKTPKKTGKYIIYSRWGVQSNLVTNHLGVLFTCNPYLDGDSKAVIYNSLEQAKEALTNNDFYDNIA